MPEDIYLEDLFSPPPPSPEQFQEPEMNRFFPGGALWNTLGFLDLVLGAPARAVQGGIISGLRGEDVLEGAGKSLIGLSLDTGQFGIGEVASGGELLEELGYIKDKENFGNIVAGIGVDIATDLAMFNLIGAARKAALRPGSLAGQIPGVRHVSPERNLFRRLTGRKPRPDRLLMPTHDTRLQKRLIFRNILKGAEDRDEFIRQLEPLGISAVEASGGATKFAGRLKSLFDQEQRFIRFQKRLGQLPEGVQLSGRGAKLAKKLEAGVTEAQRKIDDLLGNLEFGEVHLRSLVDDKTLQDAFLALGAANVANAAKKARDLALKALPESKAMQAFKVIRFNLDRFHLGTNRPATMMEISFPNRTRMFRDVIPANMSRTGAEMLIRTRFKPRFATKLGEVIPPFLNPFDYMAVLRRTGIMNRLSPAFMDSFESITNDWAKVAKWAEEAGVRSKATRQALGRIADGDLDRAVALSEGIVNAKHLDFLDKLEEFHRSVVTRTYRDPETGVVRQLLSPAEFHKGPYLHHIPLDRQQQIFRNVVSEQDGFRNVVGVIDDIPESVRAPMLQRRLTQKGMFETDILKVSRAYITAMNRKLHMEPALREILPDLRRLNRGGDSQLFKTAEDVVHHFFGRYGALDGAFDDLAAAIGMKGHHYATRMSAVVTATAYRAMLGLNPRTSLLQLHQGVLNNSIYLGLWDSLKGFVSHVTFRGAPRLAYRDAQVMTKLGEHLSVNLSEHLPALTNAKNRVMKYVDKILFAPLNAFDNFNRGWAFHGGFNLAKRHGLSDEQAMLRGILAANETQFIYGKIGASSARSTPLGRVMLQYQSFAAKQLQFLAQQYRRQPGVMLARYVAMTGMITRSVGQHVDLSRELAPTTPGDIQNIITMDRLPGLVALEAVVDFGRAALQEAAGVPRTEQVVDPDFAVEQMARAFWSSVVPGGNLFSKFAAYQPTLEAAEAGELGAPARLVRGAGRAIGEAGAFLGLGDIREPQARVAGLRTGAVGQEKDKFGRTTRNNHSRVARELVGQLLNKLSDSANGTPVQTAAHRGFRGTAEHCGRVVTIGGWNERK